MFEQTADNHVRGQGCKKCAMLKRRPIRSIDHFVERARKFHGDKYDYSLVIYEYGRDNVTIICPDHGEFEKPVTKHLSGQGCPTCANLIPSRPRLTQDEFITRAHAIHGDKYDYSKTVYITSKPPVTIICPEHGEFEQIPNNHLGGKGCPSCSSLVSKNEQAVADYVESLGFDVERNVRGLFDAHPLNEADILIRSKNVVIEYNGVYWHSEKVKSRYNIKEKSAMAQAAGYRCIHIREDQYLENPGLIHALLRSALGVFDHRIGARQCERREIDTAEYKTLCKDNHLAGYRIASTKVGLFHKDELVAAIGYNTRNGELIRYVVKAGWQVLGALPKLLKGEAVQFSFCDLTFFTGDSYPKAGFKLLEITRPNYRYVKGVDTVGRQTRMKHRLPDIFPGCDMSMTEVEINAANGWFRLFDCGNAKYVLQG